MKHRLSLEGNDIQAVNTDEPLFESGKIVLSTGEVEVIEVNFKGNKIALNVENKDFIKRVISMRGEIGGKSQNGEKETEKTGTKKKADSSLEILKKVAETLSRNGITVILSYKGHAAVTLGSGADPWLSQLVTGTKAVALNNLFTLLEMVI